MKRWFLALLLGCGNPADTDALVECDDAPVVTWDNFGAGFVLENCQPCHASSAADRHDAPEDVIFDSEADVALWAQEILERAASEDPTMPPQGGVEEDDRIRLATWLTCYPPVAQ